MHGIGERGIDFGAKADQARSIRSGELKDTDEPGSRLEQAGPVAQLRTGLAGSRIQGRRITKRLQQTPDTGMAGRLLIFAQQRQS